MDPVLPYVSLGDRLRNIFLFHRVSQRLKNIINRNYQQKYFCNSTDLVKLFHGFFSQIFPNFFRSLKVFWKKFPETFWKNFRIFQDDFFFIIQNFLGSKKIPLPPLIQSLKMSVFIVWNSSPKTLFFEVHTISNPGPLRPPFPENSETGLGLSPDWDRPTPCSIQNSWSFLHNRGSARSSRIYIYRRKNANPKTMGFPNTQNPVKLRDCILARSCSNPVRQWEHLTSFSRKGFSVEGGPQTYISPTEKSHLRHNPDPQNRPSFHFCLP